MQTTGLVEGGCSLPFVCGNLRSGGADEIPDTQIFYIEAVVAEAAQEIVDRSS